MNQEAKWTFQWRQLAWVPLILIFVGAYISGLLYNALGVWIWLAALGAVTATVVRLFREPSTRSSLLDLLSHPIEERNRPLVLQFINRALFYTLLVALVVTALPRFQLGDTTDVLITVDFCCLAAVVALGLFAARRVAILPNVLMLGASLFFVVQIFSIYSSPSASESVTLNLPFADGDWLVVNGGRSSLINHHYGLKSQRHALDITRTSDGALSMGARELTSYASFGASVVAPRAGTVVTAIDEFSDQQIGGSDHKNPAGNYIAIDIGDSKYVILAHLQHGSIAVKTGEHVSVGQALAHIGNSGNTSQPHLHVQVQNKPIISFGSDTVTYPLLFANVDMKQGKKSWEPSQGADARRGDELRPRLAGNAAR